MGEEGLKGGVEEEAQNVHVRVKSIFVRILIWNYYANCETERFQIFIENQAREPTEDGSDVNKINGEI